MTPPFRVLSHWGDSASILLPEDLAARVSVAPIVSGTPLPAGPFDVLLTFGVATPDLEAIIATGVPWVHVTTTGVDGFPIEQLGGAILTNNRGGAGGPISEWALAMMLAFEKRVPEVWITEPSPNWYVAALGSLENTTVAIVGFGSIGQAVARKALAFDMNVRAMRRSDAPSPVAGVALVRSLDQLLPGATHVVLTAPLTPASRRMIDATAFSLMDPGTHLVNVSRGELVDHDALREALDAGIVLRASLDAVDPEPPPDGHWLYSHPSVRLSPHISNNAPNAFETMMENFWDEVRRRLDGQPPSRVVDMTAGY